MSPPRRPPSRKSPRPGEGRPSARGPSRPDRGRRADGRADTRSGPNTSAASSGPRRRPWFPSPEERRAAPAPRPAPRPQATLPSEGHHGDRSPPRAGEWLWTCREGAERDVVDELWLAGDRTARIVAPALVASAKAPSTEGRLRLTFARQGFPVAIVVDGRPREETAGSIARALAQRLDGARAYLLHTWVPDATATNPLAADARELDRAVERALAELRPGVPRLDAHDPGPEAVPLLQICVPRAGRALAGALTSARALSLAPGGRLRSHVGGDSPSRAARKLAEALAWLELAPEAGEVCVDLGAAPGGWTWWLLERRARVVAVDPARLRPDLLGHRGLRYVGQSAFEFEPDEPVDWLFCDMAWRPLEVAQMLARWGRKRWTTLLVANFKLPMKRKAETVAAIRETLESAGFRAVRTRQLYHDRDEITLTARLE